MEKEQHRRKIFDLYSRNFAFLNFHLNIAPEFIGANVYICPICYRVLTESDLDKEETVTLEHIVSRKMGGSNSRLVLTCKLCNNRFGELEGKYIDSHRQVHLQKPIKANMFVDIDGEELEFAGHIVLTAGSFIATMHSNKSNPQNARKLEDKGVENIQEFKSTIILNDRRKGYTNIVLLRMAYLTVFYIFGYEAISYPNMIKICNQIKNPKENLIDNWILDGSQITDEMLGVLFIYSPNDLRSILVSFDITIEGHKSRKIVVLPSPDIEGMDIYNKYHELNKKDVNLSYVRIEYDEYFLTNSNGMFWFRKYWAKL